MVSGRSQVNAVTRQRLHWREQILRFTQDDSFFT